MKKVLFISSLLLVVIVTTIYAANFYRVAHPTSPGSSLSADSYTMTASGSYGTIAITSEYSAEYVNLWVIDNTTNEVVAQKIIENYPGDIEGTSFTAVSGRSYTFNIWCIRSQAPGRDVDWYGYLN